MLEVIIISVKNLFQLDINLSELIFYILYFDKKKFSLKRRKEKLRGIFILLFIEHVYYIYEHNSLFTL